MTQRNRKRSRKLPHKPRKGFDFDVRLEAKNRDRWVCQMPYCESKVRLEVHHILKRQVCIEEYHWSKYKTNNIRNAITICQACHRKLHIDNLWRKYIKYFKRTIGLNTRNALYN